MLCLGVCCWYCKDITCQPVGLCIILTNPANMNEHRQTGLKSYGFGQNLLLYLHNWRSCHYCYIAQLFILFKICSDNFYPNKVSEVCSVEGRFHHAEIDLKEMHLFL